MLCEPLLRQYNERCVFADISSIGKYLYSIADVTSIPNIFGDTSALVLPPPILLASLCTLGGLKEVNTGVRMRWYSLNPGFTTSHNEHPKKFTLKRKHGPALSDMSYVKLLYLRA